MSVEIRPIAPTRSQLRRFTQFGIDLYRDNPYAVPPLVSDDVNTLSPKVNPAFDFCDCQCFMAYRDGKPVGRIAAIINRVVNERTNQKVLRFGFVDFIDDDEVVDALFDAASEWGRKHGMTEMVGPMGFTDMDHEGMLTEGFEELGTMATIYNYPYYPRQMERMGFKRDAEWIEMLIKVPEEIPEKYSRIAQIVKERNNLRVLKFTSRKKLKEQYGQAIFQLVNEAYDQLYGYSPLTPRQVEYYIGIYLGILNLKFVTLVVDENDRLVALGISIQSFSRALQKSRGKLFPFGWWYLLQALRGKTDIVDLLLIAVKPEYQNKGVNALLFTDLIPNYIAAGMKYAETNPELQTNNKVRGQWDYFDTRLHRRRCSFRKPL
ncbi:MAG: N-acetyltransferase [Muribaculaceae bacterium]|nr:N-acetyltransferase [Muribaculaceae bacterium]